MSDGRSDRTTRTGLRGDSVPSAVFRGDERRSRRPEAPGATRPLRFGSAKERPCGSDGARVTYNHMVIRPRESEESLNQLFRALADGTRRDILARSLTATPSVSELAASYDMSFAAVQKHVAVLERAGLVTRHRRGREQIVRAEREALHRAHAALDELEAVWRGRIDRAVVLLTERDEGDPR